MNSLITDSSCLNIENIIQGLLKKGSFWLQDLRKRGLEKYLQLGLPTLKDEEWKYTSLRSFQEHRFYPCAFPEVSRSYETLLIKNLVGTEIIIENGYFIKERSKNLEIHGVKILNLEEALSQHEELVKNHLGSLVKTEKFTFAALNTAVFQDLVFIHVAKDVIVESPIQILHLSNSAEKANASFPRILMVVEENAEVQLVENYVSLAKEVSFTNSVVEIKVAQNAKVEHVKIQDENINAYHVALSEVEQQRDSTYTSINMTFGGKTTRNDINAWLGGTGIHSTLDGAYILKGEQVADNHTCIDHAFPNCYSWEMYKGILDEQSIGVFNGKIFVHEDAQKTDAKQTNQALLLSKGATINTKPQLEIFADDVKCTHGATIGQLSKESVFYLKARGISEDQAKAMLVHAFAGEVIQTVSMEPVKDYLESLLYTKLIRGCRH